ncbi:MAG: hypothetical protein BMS9Abin14_527 [Gammaproteobacteria bacterium]|nr:MAG: hypothetical protein BMS9Abin14_527 [Gammaproteobacteria bacterium]
MRFAAAMIAVGLTLLGTESSLSSESPLARCWKQAETRIELAPCLEKLLQDADDRLGRMQSKVKRQASELDRVTGYRSDNVAKFRASDARWRAYRDAECDRQAQAMSPGTGSGDVYLACRITLTNERVKHLGMP